MSRFIRFIRSPYVWYIVHGLIFLAVMVAATACRRLDKIGPFGHG